MHFAWKRNQSARSMWSVASLALSLVAGILVLQLSSVAQTSNTPSATVQVPRLIRFSGRLTPPSPATGSSRVVNVVFSLYAEETGGTALWQERQNVELDAMGHYTVLLGFTQAEGLPIELFTTGEAHWLGVQPEGEVEQPRVMLVSVPFALKAHEAETLGGKSVSDFVLATPDSSASGSAGSGNGNAVASNGPNVGGSGTTDFIPLWTDSNGDLGNSVLFQSGSGNSAAVGINTTTPAATLDVNGGAIARGVLQLPSTGTANASQGYNSQPFDLQGSAFNSSTQKAVGPLFQWQTEPVGNNTSSPSGSLNLLYGAGSGKPSETGLNIASNGQITFATGQTFPGTGTITGVTAGTGLTGGGTSGNVTLSINTSFADQYYAQLKAPNTFTANQTVNGTVTATTFSGSGSGVTGIPFGNLTGTLANTQFSGTYSNAVTLSNTSNVFYGNGANLTGVPVGSGSPNYIQNGTKPQKNANFNITGSGVLSGTLVANAGVSAMLTTGTGSAVSGTATVTSGNTYGVMGKNASTTGVGVYGWASSTTGNDSGIVGQTDSNTNNASGVFGVATAQSGQVYGVVGSTNSTTQNASGVYGNTGSSTTGATNGVFGQTNSTDGNAVGVYGLASSTTGGASGVEGNTAAPNGYGVWGISTATSGTGYGVVGQSSTAAGVYGISSGAQGAGVTAYNTNTSSGEAQAIYAVAYSSNAAAGFFRNIGGGYILIGANGNSNNFYVDASGDGYFAGNLQVSGTLSKGGGSFKIDDPIDPANKTLSHSFVESPDMMNIYNGLVRLDARGEAWVELPQYFEALNRDFRYQLTSVGASQPRLYIAHEVEGNRFKIAGGKANAKVSWQVTGIRQDAWANAHRIPNEEEKALEKRGSYLYPELYGADAQKETDAILRR